MNPPPQPPAYRILLIDDVADHGKLIGEMLELAHHPYVVEIASGPAMLDLGAIVARTVGVLSPVGEDKGVRVNADIPEGLPCFADEHMIDTVIRNLVNNAITFTPEGGAVTISGRSDGDRCEITVADSGVGLTLEQIRIRHRAPKAKEKRVWDCCYAATF